MCIPGKGNSKTLRITEGRRLHDSLGNCSSSVSPRLIIAIVAIIIFTLMMTKSKTKCIEGGKRQSVRVHRKESRKP